MHGYNGTILSSWEVVVWNEQNSVQNLNQTNFLPMCTQLEIIINNYSQRMKTKWHTFSYPLRWSKILVDNKREAGFTTGREDNLTWMSFSFTFKMHTCHLCLYLPSASYFTSVPWMHPPFAKPFPFSTYLCKTISHVSTHHFMG